MMMIDELCQHNTAKVIRRTVCGQITRKSYDNLMTYEYLKSNLWQSYNRS